ncbi:malate synthase A [Flagellimonas zhangzhouensis]|uniref:Malate synthase n=1 Tax=Flagellimonas zhangzhouensis TaxID=1073328 RepID=A0A1H2QAF4_9FLAO|nr:malate synthase A [Allomuricauda zhangzhouensis]SDQ50666.1 malate synthase [Allomuricauda zhangzhouensis]SDW04075.1 malate synthase [Allomuricauda zhangzhouensis]
MEEIVITSTELQFAKDVSNYYPELLTDEAIEFLVSLHQKFNKSRLQLLEERTKRQAQFDLGIAPNFPEETVYTRTAQWKVKNIPEDLRDRRVEITGPVERKMVINALNSGAKTFMADFEDSNAPTWYNCMQGQQNLIDANNRSITYFDSKKGKNYELNKEVAVLLVRPRGLHLNERHLLINGEQASGSLVDFGLYVFHNTKILKERKSAPYFYLPKLEHYTEARWWNEVFSFAEELLDVSDGTFKATVLIETITASFQLDEIIYELKNHIVGLNCGRWDYIFSYIKKFRNHPEYILPDRDQVTMTVPFMDAYSKLVIQRCHKRGILAIGGMAAQIPINNDPVANEAALEKVRLDKEREAKNGHDGTWVAHPGLVPIAMETFNKYMPSANQVVVLREDDRISAADLIAVPKGEITEKGVRKNISVGIMYLESWLRGNGCVAINNLMEDAATAEISRTQVWQWLKFNAMLDDGRKLTSELYQSILDEEVAKIRHLVGEGNLHNTKFEEAIALFDQLVKAEDFEEFLTLKAYDEI